MPDLVFSAARLRGYRVLETAGLGDALSLQILDRVIAGRLWLPYSLIEIAFRNAADRCVTGAHKAGEDWLIQDGRDGDAFLAKSVSGAKAFRGQRDDATEDDPIGEAARMAGRQLNRDRISRDDLVAHLMLGFWVSRCPGALAADGIDLWKLLAANLALPLNDAARLAKVMTQLLRIRNRIAHHEPLLFRAKHVFAAKDGSPKTGATLISDLQAAIPPFLAEVALATETAKAFAPMASKYLDAIPDQIRVEIAPLEAALAAERRRLKEAREARIAARQAERAAGDKRNRARP